MSSSDQLTVFRHEGVDLRVLLIDGEPWWIASDVAKALGYRDANRIISRLEEDERGTASVGTPGGPQTVSILNESGLYVAILGSQLPSAQEFRRWVTREVLPSIRRTGTYTAPVAAPALPQDYASALRALAAEVESREAYEERVRELEPKADYVDRFVSNDDLVTVRSAASQLGMRETALRDWLVEHHWVYKVFIGRRWSEKKHEMVEEWEYRARSEHGDSFRLRAQHNAPRHHNNQLRQTLYLTPEGLLQLAKRVGVQAVQA